MSRRIGSNENKRPRRPDEFEAQLYRQIGFLQRSCATFDQGIHDEAIQTAALIRTLVHQTAGPGSRGTSTSLLTHLGIQAQLRVIDTGIYRSLLGPALQEWCNQNHPGMKVAGHSPTDVGLAEVRITPEGRAGWFAPLRLKRFAPGTPPDEACPGTSPFEIWWNDPLIESSNGRSFSRKNLILIMANQDGGAHVDAGIDADYDDFIVDPLVQIEVGSDLEDKTLGGEVASALNNIAFASVRQIAFELLGTIERYLHVKNNPGVMASNNPFEGIPREATPDGVIRIPAPVALSPSE